MIRAIVAVDNKWGIGKKNDLLFKIPADMKFFREKTAGATVCMGYNTLLSFPGGTPLPNRKNIVLCPEGTVIDGAIAVHDLTSLFDELKKGGDAFVIGGAMFYHTMLYYCEEILVTKVDADGQAEVFFDDLDKDEAFELVYESEPIETNGYTIRFTTYKNKAPKELAV